MKKLLFVLMASLALVSCSKGPESAAKNFTEHMAKGDINEAKKYTTTQTGALLDMAISLGGSQSMPKYPDYTFKMLKDSIVGDTAAWVTYTTPEGNDDVLTLVKEDNEWKVSMGK
jgi:putative hemolysin